MGWFICIANSQSADWLISWKTAWWFLTEKGKKKNLQPPNLWGRMHNQLNSVWFWLTYCKVKPQGQFYGAVIWACSSISAHVHNNLHVLRLESWVSRMTVQRFNSFLSICLHNHNFTTVHTCTNTHMYVKVYVCVCMHVYVSLGFVWVQPDLSGSLPELGVSQRAQGFLQQCSHNGTR